MIVAVVAVHVLKVTVDQVVDVIPMRNGLVTAAWPVDMVRVMPTAAVVRRAVSRVGRRDRDHVLIDVIPVRMMQVTIVEVIDVPFVNDGLVAATGAVDVVVRLMGLTIRHRSSPGSASLEAVFFHMIKGADQQVSNVVIRDGVIDVLAPSLLGHQTRLMELLEALGDGRHLL